MILHRFSYGLYYKLTTILQRVGQRNIEFHLPIVSNYLKEGRGEGGAESVSGIEGDHFL